MASAASGTPIAPAADRSVSPAHPSAATGSNHVLRVGGRAHWRSYLTFDVPAGSRVDRAVLRLSGGRAWPSSLNVRVAIGSPLDESATGPGSTPRVGAQVAYLRHRAACATRARRARNVACRRLSLDVTRAAVPGRPLSLVLTSSSSGVIRLPSREASKGGPRLVVSVTRTAGPAVATPQAAVGPASGAPSAGPVVGLWTTAAELASRPTSGPAWQAMKAAADASPGTADISDQNSSHDISTLATALVYARTGNAAYRAKTVADIAAAIGTERGGRTLALGRNLASYVIAADLIGLGGADPATDARFRAWLSAVRTENLSGDTLISTSEQRPNNWGTMAGASRVAADAYLGDTADLDRAATVFRGWLGDRSAYSGFNYGDMSWQVDPRNPVGVQPAGASKNGLVIDGALADDMRRGCALATPPCHTNYPWEAMQGVVVEAQLLSRRGYDAFNWSNQAVLRAALFLKRLDQAYGGWWASQDDEWQPWVLNHAYHASLPETTPAEPGKIMGWTDWVFG
ncbi:hypothetical protein FSW04_17250 [Baekduia soli]|uniref:Uncharacterized protein n=1 Tax=Baekduia soli TaxID=496014 RepID=A0A5B8U895_9ACTN|nr:alginate lyase family protein [Baekduia soli]QEC49151.1 hypothetical protein FSW04_17250 [Baekduia soli]